MYGMFQRKHLPNMDEPLIARHEPSEQISSEGVLDQYSRDVCVRECDLTKTTGATSEMFAIAHHLAQPR